MPPLDVLRTCDREQDDDDEGDTKQARMRNADERRVSFIKYSPWAATE